MTRAVLFIVGGCVALIAMAIVSVLSRDLIPEAPFAAKPLTMPELRGPSPNIESKRDKLEVSAEPARTLGSRFDDAQVGLRQAYAPELQPVEPGEPIAGPIPMPRPRGASRPAVQKNYTLLSDTQIAAIKGRLRLTAAQESLWPDVENALRAFAKSLHDKRQANPSAGIPVIETTSAEVEQLKAAAMPLIAKLREDQKREVRQLARIIGLDAIASQI